ncbi:hypothetical protein FIBSPDRAFT_90064 [Athelia psychrophila]|uniref:Uncharacterized protein n=1 Tax=Athelia psychrophila TaxID=1759441 RepID=A0A167SUU1_9AGAM|nr:hypothetical protein FIBSPDRAFT_90064 [Fibularhizoctonia sp. CBS 109695]
MKEAMNMGIKKFSPGTVNHRAQTGVNIPGERHAQHPRVNLHPGKFTPSRVTPREPTVDCIQ